MKGNRGRDGDGSELGDASGSITSPRPDDSSKAEEKRLRARRRILKGGVGGVTAVILSVYQRPSKAHHDKGKDKDKNKGKDRSKKASVVCNLQGGEQRKVGVSLCLSIGRVA